MDWKPDRILRAILIWTMITLILVWLPFVRGLMVVGPIGVIAEYRNEE